MTNLTKKVSAFIVPACFYVATLFVAPFLPSNAHAQDGDYLQLNSFSPFYCKYLANGKTQIAEKSASGKFRKISFDKARDKSKKRKAQLRNYQKKLFAIKRKLEQQRLEIEFGPAELTENEKKLIINFGDGLRDGDDLVVTDVRETIAGLGQWLNDLQVNIEFQNLERKQINDCQKRKLPPINSIPITYEVLIAEDRSSTAFRWYAVGVVFMSEPAALFPTYGSNFICLEFQNGIKRLVAFNGDPVGAQDSLLSYQSNHPIVLAGETARLLPRDGQNRLLALGYSPALFAKSGGASKRESVENSVKSALPKAMEKWGSSAKAARAKFDKKKNNWVCPEL